MSYTHTPDEVIRLANEGRLEEWIHAFLMSVGRNEGLSDGLKLQPRYWIGPVLMPLNRMERCCGPEPTMEYVMDPDHWEQHTGRMVASLEKGWMPPPLIAQYGHEKAFILRDGNHRYHALSRAGREAYWCIVWCDSEEVRQEALGRLADLM